MKTIENFKKVCDDYNTQQLFEYAYNLGWKEAIEKTKKEMDDYLKSYKKL